MNETLFKKFYDAYRNICVRAGIPQDKIPDEKFVKERMEVLLDSYDAVCLDKLEESHAKTMQDIVGEYDATLAESYPDVDFRKDLKSELRSKFVAVRSEALDEINSALLMVLKDGRSLISLGNAIRDLEDQVASLRQELISQGVNPDKIEENNGEDDLKVILKLRLVSQVLKELKEEFASKHARAKVKESPTLNEIQKTTEQKSDIILEQMCDNAAAVLTAAEDDLTEVSIKTSAEETPPPPYSKTLTQLEQYVRDKYQDVEKELRSKIDADNIVDQLEQNIWGAFEAIDVHKAEFDVKSVERFEAIIMLGIDEIRDNSIALNISDFRDNVLYLLDQYENYVMALQGTPELLGFLEKVEPLYNILKILASNLNACVAQNSTIIAFETGLKDNARCAQLREIIRADKKLNARVQSQLLRELNMIDHAEDKATKVVSGFSSVLRRESTRSEPNKDVVQKATTYITPPAMSSKKLFDTQLNHSATSGDTMDYAKTLLLALISLATYSDMDEAMPGGTYSGLFKIKTYSSQLFYRLHTNLFFLLGRTAPREETRPEPDPRERATSVTVRGAEADIAAKEAMLRRQAFPPKASMPQARKRGSLLPLFRRGSVTKPVAATQSASKPEPQPPEPPTTETAIVPRGTRFRWPFGKR